MNEINEIVSRLQTLLQVEQKNKDIRDVFASSKKLMSSYRCAMMEIETKFKVLNDYFSLQHERNPPYSVLTQDFFGDNVFTKTQIILVFTP